MLNLGRVLIVAALLIASSMSAFAQDKSETFLVTGMGSTHELAVQNAASNALTAAVGKFVDVKTQIEKRTEIKDGVALITKDLTENFIASSNGTIEKIEVLSSKSDAGLFTVEAVIDVRMDDLRTALAGRVELSKPMDKNVFSAVKANRDNSSQKVEALVNGLFLPSQDVSLISASVGEPFDLRRLPDEPSLLSGVYNRPVVFGAVLELFDKSRVNYSSDGAASDLRNHLAQAKSNHIIVPVELAFDKEVLVSWEQMVKSVSASSQDFAIDGLTSLVFESDNRYKVNQDLWRSIYEPDPASISICFVRLGADVRCYLIKDLPAQLDPEQFPIFSDAAEQGYNQLVRKNLLPDVKVSLVSSDNGQIASLELNDGSVAWDFAYRSRAEQIPELLEAEPSLITSFGARQVFAIFDKKTVHVMFPLTDEQLKASENIRLEIIPAENPYR